MIWVDIAAVGRKCKLRFKRCFEFLVCIIGISGGRLLTGGKHRMLTAKPSKQGVSSPSNFSTPHLHQQMSVVPYGSILEHVHLHDWSKGPNLIWANRRPLGKIGRGLEQERVGRDGTRTPTHSCMVPQLPAQVTVRSTNEFRRIGRKEPLVKSSFEGTLEYARVAVTHVCIVWFEAGPTELRVSFHTECIHGPSFDRF